MIHRMGSCHHGGVSKWILIHWNIKPTSFIFYGEYNTTWKGSQMTSKPSAVTLKGNTTNTHTSAESKCIGSISLQCEIHESMRAQPKWCWLRSLRCLILNLYVCTFGQQSIYILDMSIMCCPNQWWFVELHHSKCTYRYNSQEHIRSQPTHTTETPAGFKRVKSYSSWLMDTFVWSGTYTQWFMDLGSLCHDNVSKYMLLHWNIQPTIFSFYASDNLPTWLGPKPTRKSNAVTLKES